MLFKVRLHIDKIKMCFHVKQSISYYQIQMEKELIWRRYFAGAAKTAEQEDIAGDFHNKRILVIHSGGDSKRVPQYSVCGKLFSPVPRELPDGRASTLFDEFLIGMAGVPSRFREGMLVLSVMSFFCLIHYRLMHSFMVLQQSL